MDMTTNYTYLLLLLHREYSMLTPAPILKQLVACQLMSALSWMPLDDSEGGTSDESNSSYVTLPVHLRSPEDELVWVPSCTAQSPDWYSALTATPIYAALIAPSGDYVT